MTALHSAADSDGINATSDAREGHGGGAHRAGLQRDVKVAVDQPLGAEACGGLADRQHFGMRRWVVVAQRTVAGTSHYRTVADDHATDRDLAGAFGGACFN